LVDFIVDVVGDF